MNQRKKVDLRAVLIVAAFVVFAVVYLFGPFGQPTDNDRSQQSTQPAAVQTQDESADQADDQAQSQEPQQQSESSESAEGSSKQDATQQEEPEQSTDNATSTEPEEDVEEPQTNTQEPSSSTAESYEDELTVEEDGWYTSKEEVALYIHTYGHLPDNFISKTKAKRAGWESSEGNLDEVLPGMSIGGSRFYNDEGKLPEASGREWTECDINYHGGYRGAERIVFSNDGLIFYTDDHYETFEQLY